MTTILIVNSINKSLDLKNLLEKNGLTVFTANGDPFNLLSKYSAVCPDMMLVDQEVKERCSLLKHINSNYGHTYTFMYTAADKISDIDPVAEHIDRIITDNYTADDICKIILDDIRSGKAAKRSSAADISSIRSAFKELCITPNYVGYKYLIDSVEIILSKQEENLSLTKLIYPVIAKKYNVSACSVERSIRTAINSSWDKIPDTALIKYFGIYAVTPEFKPSNSRFIYGVAECFMDERHRTYYKK